MSGKEKRTDEALGVLIALGLPKAQQNERTALCLLALLDLPAGRAWAAARSPLIGITPIMEWVEKHYDKKWAPNTRETVRRQSMHQLVDAGIALYNPDNPKRAVNSPKAVYQLEPSLLKVLTKFGRPEFDTTLATYMQKRVSLAATYAKARQQNLVPVQIKDGAFIDLSPGEHSELIKKIIEEFGGRFAPGGELVYVGDTGTKWGYYNAHLLRDLGVEVGSHGKMPDVVIYDRGKNWLLLLEAVTSHGPVDGKRHAELAKIFQASTAGLVYVSAFPNRRVMNRYVEAISWETEVWVADAPSHLIHFDGVRYLGPYSEG